VENIADQEQELREKGYQYSADGKLIPIPEPVPARKPETIKPLKRWMGTIFWAFVFGGWRTLPRNTPSPIASRSEFSGAALFGF